MYKEKIKLLVDRLCEIDSLIGTTCDSCEMHGYLNQAETLKIAKSYFNEVFDLLSGMKS